MGFLVEPQLVGAGSEVGPYGPTGEPGIRLGGDTVLYRVAANAFRFDDPVSGPGGNWEITSGGTITGTLLRLLNATGGGVEMGEQSPAPAAPAANRARLYSEDDGAGKTRLVVRFPTGAPIVLATEP